MRVSACIMAKNESAMIRRCLESIRWVDEIILVDTGSSDDTIRIAKEFGAKVYEHPWENDFSKHRNQTIQYATCDWVLIIDCDEEITSDMSQFKKRLDNIHSEISGLTVTINESKEGEPVTSWIGIRFFRKSSGIHYVNPVHNKAVYQGGCAATNVQFRHYGYSLDPARMAEKRARTEKLLLKRLGNEPTNPVVYYYLTQLKVGEKNYPKAEEYGLKFFEHCNLSINDFQYTSVMYFYMSWIYLHTRDNRTYHWALKGLEFYPDDLDLNYVMARIGYESKRDDLLIKHAEKYLEILPKAKNRGAIDSDKFTRAINVDDWYNRTTYTANDAAEKDIRKFMESLDA